MSRLSKKNQARAQAIADGIIKRNETPGAAIDEAYRHSMWTLNNSRSRTDWNIADEVERIVKAATRGIIA